jgi:TolA-binding protein
MNSLRMTALTVAAAAVLTVAGCGGGRSDATYEAEKLLFNARKQASELSFPALSGEFLDRAVGSYRAVLERYAGDARRVDGMELIVVSAAMELAELEFRAERYGEARDDFLAAYDLAGNIPAARANALWSAGFISHLIGDDDDARKHYARFVGEFLTPERAMETARLNRRYLLTPVRIAEIEQEAGDTREADRSLKEAQRLFRLIIDKAGTGAPEDDLAKEMRFNLLTVYLLGRRWDEAQAAVDSMKERYSGGAELPGLLMIEARIKLDGLHDTDGAISILRSIVADHPQSREAPTAMLTIGHALYARKEFRRAAEAYRELLDRYADQPYPEIVEATWQLGRLEEAQGDWLDASLRFSSVYTDFPTTLQGMEAPLYIARHYRDAGESEAARAAYERAARHYQRLASERYNETIRVIAEEYLVRALAEQDRWEEAASSLIALPGRYPGYTRFMGNYLMAASIYENELGDDTRAVETLRLCVSRYPGTDLAAEAQRQIERITAKR